MSLDRLPQSRPDLDSFPTPSITQPVTHGGRRRSQLWLGIFSPFGVFAVYVFVVALFSAGFCALLALAVWRYFWPCLRWVGRYLYRAPMRRGLLLLPVFRGDSDTFQSLLHFIWSQVSNHASIFSYVAYVFPIISLALFRLLSHAWVSGISSFAIFSPRRQFLLSNRGEGVKK